MNTMQQYKKDRQEILYHPVKVTDEGIRLMVKVIDQMEAAMRRFINYELPDCMAREEMKTLLDGERIEWDGLASLWNVDNLKPEIQKAWYKKFRPWSDEAK